MASCIEQTFPPSTPSAGRRESSSAPHLLTVLNVDIGCLVRKNIEGWKQSWGSKPNHPPGNSLGTVVGWTDEESNVNGDPSVGEFSEIVRVQFPEKDGPRNYRMGFAGEHWLVLVGGGTVREKKVFGQDLEKSSCTGRFFRTSRREDVEGQELPFVPRIETEGEKTHSASKRVFWRVHEGDVEAVRGLLGKDVDIDAGIQPYLFPDDDDTVAWPYQVFDGKYGDTLLILATRYCHGDMLEMLLQAGANKDKENDEGESAVDVAKELVGNPCKISSRPFSDINRLYQSKELIGGEVCVSHSESQETGLLCRPASDVYTCTAAGTESSISWIIVNGHSDKAQVDYCTSMVSQWKTVLTQRGDTAETTLLCPTKMEMSLALKEHFEKNSGKPVGVFAIAHGGADGGRWVSFNPENEEETFAWSDIAACGAMRHPSQLFVVADTCYSARLGKSAFMDFQRRDGEGEPLPSFCFLGASDVAEKNFSAMFALDQLANHRVISRETCNTFLEKKLPIALAENIPFPKSNDFNPYLFLYVPFSTLKQCVEKSLQPIYAL